MNVDLPKIKAIDYDIDTFGVLGKDAKFNQRIVQEAIDYISDNDGGRLVLHPGIYELGPIELKSGVNLYIPRNCYLKFIKTKEFYHVQNFNYEGKDAIRCNSPISIHNAHDVIISGEGFIDGCGNDWRPLKNWKVTTKQYNALLKKSEYIVHDKDTEIWYPSKSSYEGCLANNDNMSLLEAQNYYDYFRPVLISIYRCERVLMEGVTSMNSPAWNIHPLFSNHLTFKNLIVKNEYSAQNGDGIDIESCNTVEVDHCLFEVGDDGICIKAGKNKEARKIKIPCQNVYIHDSIVFHAHGGIVIGSEMSRGVKDVLCKDCSFIGTDIGIRFKSTIGRGGVVEDINIKNIYMTDIKEEAMIFNMDYSLYKMAHEATDDVITTDPADIPYFRNIKIDNVICSNAKTFFKVKGINKETISNITVSNSTFTCQNDFEMENASELHFKNITLNINGQIEEIQNKYIEEC